MAKAERKPINGLGAEPPAVPRGRAHGQGAKPPEDERKLNFDNTITPLILSLK